MHQSPKLLPAAVLTWIAAFLAAALFVSPASAERRRRPSLAPVPDRVPPRPENTTKCNYQEPQEFLIRRNHIPKMGMSREEIRERSKLLRKAIEYRTKQYGYFEGFGRPAWNDRSPAQNAKLTEFMGLKVRLNKQILPALQCVEEQIKQECSDTPYEPRRLSGLRNRNTYHTNEVSNHVYGIGIDIDPTENTCCGCVAQWADHPLCKQDVDSIYDRMAMPECWVHVFERFGFFWLGRDKLQDTMHFEFLGHTDRILKSDWTPPPDPDAGPAADAGPATGDAAPLASADAAPLTSADAAPTAEGDDEDHQVEIATPSSASGCSCASATSFSSSRALFHTLLF